MLKNIIIAFLLVCAVVAAQQPQPVDPDSLTLSQFALENASLRRENNRLRAQVATCEAMLAKLPKPAPEAKK